MGAVFDNEDSRDEESVGAGYDGAAAGHQPDWPQTPVRGAPIACRVLGLGFHLPFSSTPPRRRRRRQHTCACLFILSVISSARFRFTISLTVSC